MGQDWNPKAYAANGAFVYGLAGGVLEWLAAQPGECILDLGCGNGALTEQLAARSARVEGVDLSAEMVAAARTRGLAVLQASAEKLPQKDESFDAVFSNAALHWVQDQDAMLAEVHRVLKPGGRFVAEMGGQGNVAAIRVALAAILERYGYAGLEEEANYFSTPELYAERLARHGFRVERIELIPRPTPLPESGMQGWLRTFRRGVLEALPESLREKVVAETEALLRPVLCDEAGNWTADYVRLRFIARA